GIGKSRLARKAPSTNKILVILSNSSSGQDFDKFQSPLCSATRPKAAARARDRGIKVAWGRCWEAGGAPAYWPWVQSLRACVRGAGSEELRSQLGSGAPLVAQIVAEVA